MDNPQNPLEDYMSTREAAAEIGVEYPAFMARIRKGGIDVGRIGWNKFIHKDEVARLKQLEQEHKHANDSKSVEGSTR